MEKENMSENMSRFIEKIRGAAEEGEKISDLDLTSEDVSSVAQKILDVKLICVPCSWIRNKTAFVNFTFEKIRFDRAIMDNIHFKGCIFIECSFINASTRGTQFIECVFEGCDEPAVEPAEPAEPAVEPAVEPAKPQAKPVYKPVYLFYLVGVDWYSGDQGDFPNHSSFPSYHSSSFLKAKAKYEELASGDRSWSCGSQGAYLVGARPDGKFDLLQGRDPN